MDNKWHINHLKQIREKAGPRYTPALNVNLPISEIFDGISRTEKFYTTIRGKYGELLHEFKHVTSKYEEKELQEIYGQIKKKIESIFKLIENIKEYNTSHIPWDEIQQQTKATGENLLEFTSKLREAKERVKDVKTPPREDGSYRASPSEKFSSDIHYIYETQERIRYFENLSSSTKAQLSNHPFLLLTGSAGTGKTHLLCDLVEQRIKSSKGSLPAFLVFGEYFTNGKDFWDQALEQLEIKKLIKTKENFLEKLDNFGKKTKCRSLLIIDALNENIIQAPIFWKSNLDSIMQDIKKYPNIAFIVSVRNGYEKNVLSKKIQKKLIKVEHYGFSQKIIWSAMNSFFKYYNITSPEVPLLHPEFYNPLFLKFFCKKNKNSKLSLKGGNALKDVFEDFVIEIGVEILKEFDPNAKKRKNGKNVLWDGIIKDMALWMASNGKTRIPILELKKIVKKYFPTKKEQVIALMERRVLINKKELDTDISYAFSYNKFSDHIIVRTLLASINPAQRKNEFQEKGKIWQVLQNFKYDYGILEAMCIQVPEFFHKENKKEIFELAPYILKDNNFEYPFKESLIWRDPKTIDEKVIKIIEKDIKRKSDFFLEPILSLVSFPDNSLNARLLDSLLISFSLPERDSWWSTFLHYQYGEHGAVDRLIEWSWADRDNSHINDDSIFLTCIALAWFLTTSNRFIRDKATKGLVCLLQNRIHLLPELLEKFKSVNDPYVIERLFAVAYACVLRNQEDTKNLKVLAEWIYENIFKDNKPPVHILLRDYARGVIEVALKRGIKLNINENNINPPYRSRWPKKIPSEKELRDAYYPEDSSQRKTGEKDYWTIWRSLMYSYGGFPADFGNYVVNSHLRPWSGRNLKHPEPDRKNLLEKFQGELTTKQKELLGKAMNPYGYIKIVLVSAEDKLSEDEVKRRESERRKEQKKGYTRFKNCLPTVQKEYFEKEIEPFLDDRGSIKDPLDSFDTKLAQRWIFNRVMEVGYDPKIHGQFDENVFSMDRIKHKAERIGKKYQWIAYHEFLALVSDHFEFKGDSWDESAKEYKGPWASYIRDIDPSFILQNDNHIKETAIFSRWKSKHGCYDAWREIKSDINWIKTSSDLPKPEHIIHIVDDNKKNWLILEGFVKWEEKTPPEYKKYDIPVREVWYILKSYIVKKEDVKKFCGWAIEKDFWGRWMPESSAFYEIFLGEYPNSLAFEDLRGNFNIWIKSGRENDDLPVPVVVTDDHYLNEFTLDCSYDGSISIKLPCKWLVNNMELYHEFLDGRFYDKKENLVTLITNVFEENFPSALLIDKKTLIDFLNKNGYAIFWTLLGEKRLMGGSFSRKDFIGDLQISGTYTLDDRGNVVGKSKNKFIK